MIVGSCYLVGKTPVPSRIMNKNGVSSISYWAKSHLRSPFFPNDGSDSLGFFYRDLIFIFTVCQHAGMKRK